MFLESIIYLIESIIYIFSLLLFPFVTKYDSKKSKIKKIKFVDFYKDMDKKNNYFTKLLKKFNHKFEVVENDPDILIFSMFGMTQFIPDNILRLKYKNCKFVYTTQEYQSMNKKSISRFADLNLTFQYTNKYNNIRLPYFLFSNVKNLKLERKKRYTKFCCFVYSNSIKHRENFCKKLSNYKKIDCGGKSLNNLGYRVENKIEYQKDYKFCIAYENHSQSGYTTEKLLDAFLSGCLPIYYGNPYIYTDFNKGTFINANDFKNEEELINYIVKVDNDDELYNSYFNKEVFTDKWLSIQNDPEEKYFKLIADSIIS